ncbi:hypothetical protein V3C99_001475, partial [Haemonchus contortus]
INLSCSKNWSSSWSIGLDVHWASQNRFYSRDYFVVLRHASPPLYVLPLPCLAGRRRAALVILVALEVEALSLDPHRMQFFIL